MIGSIRLSVGCAMILLFFSGTGFPSESSETPGELGTEHGSRYSTLQSTDPASVTDHPGKSNGNPTGAITLKQALALGLLQNPELAASFWEVRAAEARLIQEGLLPNPEIESSLENFGGSKDLSGFDGAETTIQIKQKIELGGKREKREQVAALGKDIAQWDYESKRLDVVADISKSFWDVLAAQEKYAIAGEIKAVTEDAYNLVAERVKAGKAPPLEEIQSKVTVTKIRIEFEQTKRALETARKKLAATWGSPRPVFEKVIADIDPLVPPPSLENSEVYLSQNPDLAKWDTEMEKNRALVKLADADSIPDLTAGVGPRYYSESKEVAFVMNLSVPIPLFNRNQGGIKEASFNLVRARESRKAAVLTAQKNLDQAYQDLSASYLTADSLIKTAIPAAESAFSAALEGYREGKIGYLSVLETQRTFFEVKYQYVTAIVDYHKSKADFERLVGQNPADNK